MPAFVRLLRDNEAEVRVAAAAKLSAFCKILEGDAVVAALLPCVKELSTDGSQVLGVPITPLPHASSPLPCIVQKTRTPLPTASCPWNM